MAWNMNSDKPIYAQLMDQISNQIVSGKYPPGSKLPSVREFAFDAAVNPNTMQKALSELERSGLIITQRTMGRTVTEDEEVIGNIRKEMAEESLKGFLSRMKELGFSAKETVALLQEIVMKEENV